MEYSSKNTTLSNSPKSGQGCGDVQSTDVCLQKPVIDDGAKGCSDKKDYTKSGRSGG